MFCTKCGAKIEDGAKFCTSCGQPTEEAAAPVQNSTAPEAAPATADAAPVQETAPAAPSEKKDSAGELTAKAKVFFAALAAKVKPALKKADDKAGEILGNKKNYVYAGVLALLGIIITVSVIAAIIPNDNGYLTYDTQPYVVDHDDQVYIIKEGKLIAIKTDAEEVDSSKSSIDGKVTVFQYDGDLYRIKGKKASVIAEDVSGYTLSLYGDAVVYTVTDGLETVYYYCKLGGKPVEIYVSEIDLVDGSLLTSYVISPDGKSVAYTVTEELDSDLYYFNGKKSEEVASCDGTVIGMSNGGKYIYAAIVNEDLTGTTLYSFNKKGEKTKIDSCSASKFYLNLDGTEIMFFNDGRSYISVKGKKAVKAASAELSLARPRYTTSHASSSTAYFYPVESLYNHVYTSGSTAYFVSKNETKNIKLVSADSTRFTLDDSAEFLYYMDDESLMCLKISQGENAKGKAKEIAEDVESYVVSSDRKYLYYVSDESLYVVNGKKGGKPKMLSNDDVSTSLTVSNDDVVYYICDGAVCAAKGRSKGKAVLDDAGFQNIGGYVYIADDDVFYSARGTRKPKKLLEND